MDMNVMMALVLFIIGGAILLSLSVYSNDVANNSSSIAAVRDARRRLAEQLIDYEYNEHAVLSLPSKRDYDKLDIAASAISMLDIPSIVKAFQDDNRARGLWHDYQSSIASAKANLGESGSALRDYFEFRRFQKELVSPSVMTRPQFSFTLKAQYTSPQGKRHYESEYTLDERALYGLVQTILNVTSASVKPISPPRMIAIPKRTAPAVSPAVATQGRPKQRVSADYFNTYRFEDDAEIVLK